MTGLFLLLLAVLWLAVASAFVLQVTRRLPATWRKAPVRALLIIAIVPLPLIDEIIGGIQFRQLCRENSTIHLDRTRAWGRTVYLANMPSRQLEGTWVRVTLIPWKYVDAKTGETIISYNTLAAAPGFFRLSGAPLTFKGYCAPGSSRRTANDLFRELHITLIEQPKNVGVRK